ncbi:DDE-type integrase/transposase/recombinase [Peribacillus butanolivorans]|uniref:DDE-type integrase/transposase/recombinase n=1 Tax=Peribacillus butanolivorans TaxID=421767 RepID=UPI0036342330
MKVKGQWLYLYVQGIPKETRLILISVKQETKKPAKHFFKKALRSLHVSKPLVITVDKSPFFLSNHICIRTAFNEFLLLYIDTLKVFLIFLNQLIISRLFNA